MTQGVFGLLTSLRQRYWAARGNALESYYWVRTDLRSVIGKMKRHALYSNSGPYSWCRYLTALLESGAEAEFRRQFSSFAKHPQNIEYLSQFGRLACKAVELGCDAPSVTRTCAVFSRVFANHERKALARFVSGKSVAIVGNGPNELNNGLGSEIDAHDVVIRINNHDLGGYERDYGTRTDIWVKARSELIRHECASEEGIQFVYYACDWSRHRCDDAYRAAIERELNQGLTVDYSDRFDRAFFVDEAGFHPTTGTFMIELLRHLPVSVIDAYGFSFLDDETEYLHFNNDLSKEVLARELKGHPGFDREKAYLKSLFGAGRRIFPCPDAGGALT